MLAQACFHSVCYHLPTQVTSNQDLEAVFPKWNAERILSKTGISTRHVAQAGECASDLAYEAACKLFAKVGDKVRDEIDFLVLCTQTPDYFLPTTACLLQNRLGLPTTIGALDINLGCSGYVYGLSFAKGLLETGQASKVLLLTADTYSKFLKPEDHAVRTLFGDGAAATLLTTSQSDEVQLGPFIFGTDGSGADKLIVREGGLRSWPLTSQPACLSMSGADIFAFTLKAVPPAVQKIMRLVNASIDDVDHFVFHQANEYMLEHLREKIGIPPEKFLIALEHCGNTVSSSIPIAISEADKRGAFRPGDRLLLVGFGVGYSWGATFMRWPDTGKGTL